ncbi:uncharacterized protein LOC115196282 isoform X2 [Salmo trutta]|uniref:uncharacterized protein LOC115196282 isoform X2 n=1 Tax=Salmo trutta TaxID=8032 RepID=UPI001131E6D3|nr:uncharacterized protein LOC115196282 isoform X2 [Salmo trutta]
MQREELNHISLSQPLEIKIRSRLAHMPKLTLIRLCFWLCLARTVVSRDDLSLNVGDVLVLTPDKSTVTDPITSILWKHGKNKVAEWDKDFGGLDIYAAFINRTTLDQTTGELRISGLKKTDSGVYSVEFNSKLLNKTYKLSVIKPVPKPTITYTCNPDKSCILTCEGDTTGAEPVTYSWKVGEGAWEVIGKQLIVSKSDTGKSTSSYKYICKMKNSAGEGEVSEPVGEVFGPEPSEVGVGVVVGVVVTIVALIVIAITGSDVVQPEQGVTVPLTANTKTGEDGADKAGKGQGNGAGGLPGGVTEDQKHGV